MCEDCNNKQPSFGMPAEQRKRWCSNCAKGHSGATDIRGRKKCQDCGERQPSFGMPSDGMARWCSACAQNHPGTVNRALLWTFGESSAGSDGNPNSAPKHTTRPTPKLNAPSKRKKSEATIAQVNADAIEIIQPLGRRIKKVRAEITGVVEQPGKAPTQLAVADVKP